MSKLHSCTPRTPCLMGLHVSFTQRSAVTQRLQTEAAHASSAFSHPGRSTCFTGRFPKRKLTKEWRQLVSLLLGIPELILTSDIVHTKVAKNVGHGWGVGRGLAMDWRWCR